MQTAELGALRNRLDAPWDAWILSLIRNLGREEHPAARPSAVDLRSLNAGIAAHDFGRLPVGGVAGIRAASRNLELRARAPRASVLADRPYAGKPPDLPRALSCRQLRVVRAVRLEYEASAVRKLRERAEVADLPDNCLDYVRTFRESVDDVRLVLPVLNGAAVWAPRDELAVKREVEPFVCRDVEHERPVVLPDIELIAELEKSDISLDAFPLAVALPEIDLAMGKAAVARHPEPRGVVDWLHLQDVRVATRDACVAERAADVPRPRDGVHRSGFKLVGTCSVKPRRTVGATPDVHTEELSRPNEPLEIFSGAVEVEVGLSKESVPVRRELGGRPDGNHVEAVLPSERGVCVVKTRVHLDLVEAKLPEALVPWRIAPCLLHYYLRLRRKLADLRDKIVAPRMVCRWIPAEVARLLKRHDIPLVHGERIGDVHRTLLDDMLSVGYAVEAIGFESRVRRRRDDIVPMALERASADVERDNVELLAHRLRYLRHLPEVADREAVPDHQHLEGLSRFCIVGRKAKEYRGNRRYESDDFFHVDIIPKTAIG